MFRKILVIAIIASIFGKSLEGMQTRYIEDRRPSIGITESNKLSLDMMCKDALARIDRVEGLLKKWENKQKVERPVTRAWARQHSA